MGVTLGLSIGRDDERANQLALSSDESQPNSLHHFLTATANIQQQAKFQTNNMISRVCVW
jgi:hypothetical protein